MADLYLKALESERKQLWATCRLKGLPRDTPERQRIVDLDTQIAEHKAKSPQKAKPAKPAKPKAPKALKPAAPNPTPD
jgi:hypothetical protein